MRPHTVALVPIFTALLCGLVLAQQPVQTPPAVQAPVPPSPFGSRVVVIDPAHGGADTGARSGDILEKDLTLHFARILRAEFLRQGLRVVLTREGDEEISLDDRAALANQERGAIFVSVHVGSGGAPETARVYCYGPFAAPADLPSSSGQASPRRGLELLTWDRAQEPYAERSCRLAALVQVQLGRRFQGSPEISSPAALRELRTIAAPAIAVEISHIAAERRALEQMAPGIAQAISQGVAGFRPMFEAGAP